MHFNHDISQTVLVVGVNFDMYTHIINQGTENCDF